MTHSRPVWLLTLLLAGAPFATAQPAPQEPTVQRTWRLLAIGLDAGPRLRMDALLRGVERALSRELPGLSIRFDRDRWRDLRGPARLADDGQLLRAALDAAQAAGLEPASYDVTFVLSPRCQEPWFGQAHRVEWRDPRGRAARAVLVHSEPFALVHQGLLESLEGSGAFPAEEQAALPDPLRRALACSLRAGRAPLAALARLPGLREALLAPTIAHELGHCFAPGDRDVRDGYDRPWLQHATGPDDNPDGHGVECVLYKGRGPGFYLQKLVATRGRLIVFCDACREKLGLGGRTSSTGKWNRD